MNETEDVRALQLQASEAAGRLHRLAVAIGHEPPNCGCDICSAWGNLNAANAKLLAAWLARTGGRYKAAH